MYEEWKGKEVVVIYRGHGDTLSIRGVFVHENPTYVVLRDEHEYARFVPTSDILKIQASEKGS